MRALVINKKLTKFMQCVDMFNESKVAYGDLELEYIGKNTVTNVEETIVNEEEILKLAKHEFGEDLILLFGNLSPLYINPKIQVISNGKEWTRLIDVLTQVYKNIEFIHDDRFMNISIKQN